MPTPAENLRAYNLLSPAEKVELQSRRLLELETAHRKDTLRRSIRTEMHQRRIAAGTSRDHAVLYADGLELDRRLEDAGFKLLPFERTSWCKPKANAYVARVEGSPLNDDGSDLG